MAESRHVVENLFIEAADGARLLGTRCATCNTPYFPRSSMCHNPKCNDSKCEDAEFGPRGKIWSCAIQDFPPPAPSRYDEPYTPYAMAVVDLEDGLRVLGRVITDDPMSVEVGRDVEMVLDPLCHEEDGTALMTWKFKQV